MAEWPEAQGLLAEHALSDETGEAVPTGQAAAPHAEPLTGFVLEDGSVADGDDPRVQEMVRRRAGGQQPCCAEGPSAA